MKNCPKCNNEFDENGKWGKKQFCSRSCANSKTFTQEAKDKKSKAQILYLESLSKEKREEYFNTRNGEEARVKNLETRKYNKEKMPFEDLSWESKRKKVVEEQQFSCNHCFLSEWRGSPIPLEIDHINGIRSDNSRSNLEALCPNCHALTPTWRGKNKPVKNGDNVVDDNNSFNLLSTEKNIRQALLKAGLAAKGANYARAKRLLSEITLDTKS